MERADFLAHNAPKHHVYLGRDENAQALFLAQAACTLMAGNPDLQVQDAVDKALEAYHQVHEAFVKAHIDVYGEH